MFVATLHRIVSFGWQEYVIDELDKIDSFEDTQETRLAEATGETPEEAVADLIGQINDPGSLGTWEDKKLTWATKTSKDGSYGDPVERFEVSLWDVDDNSWWLADHDAPELWASLGARLRGEGSC